ncbi:MAG TPA: CDP-alcohol phosphatidyltransferase family protein [Polyangiaceae bacterium]|jgi:phosphatidylglycerophosphate synthase
MPAAQAERTLEAWSRGHALLALCAALAAWQLGKLWPLSLEAALAFPILIFRHLPVATPSGRLGAANSVTALRLLLMLWLALRSNDLGSLVTGAGVGLVFALDAVDGWLARQRNEASEFGAHFDMETDALLVQLSAFMLLRQGQAGLWILLAGALRYLYVIATWLMPPPAGDPGRSRLGRYVFSFYMTSAIACFLVPRAISLPWSALATLALVASFTRSTIMAYARA